MKKEKKRKAYPSDLTDEQRAEIAPLYTEMRNCRWRKRELTSAVLYFGGFRVQMEAVTP